MRSPGDVQSSMVPRSYLFVPADRPERFVKAYVAGADAVIVDLEDAVSPEDKTSARAALEAWLSAERPVFIRINGTNTEWFQDDVELCRMPGVAGIVLPKAERMEDLHHVRDLAKETLPILPIIETAQGLWNAHAIAQVPSVQRLCFGSIDFQLDLGVHGNGEELLHFQSQLVLVSRVAGLEAPVDGVSTAIDQPEQLRTDVLRCRRLGFGGKLCIHPNQIDIIHQCFLPTSEEIEWAERILSAGSDASCGPIKVDGEMVDRPVMLRAQEILSAAKQPSSAGKPSRTADDTRKPHWAGPSGGAT